MPFVNKNREIKRYKSYGPFKVSRTERWLAPDRIDKVTVWWFGQRKIIWERAK